MAPPALTWFAHPTNGKQYALTPPGVWAKGEALAQEYGGHTVSMADLAEELWLKNVFFTSGLVSGNVYIGLTDEDVEGSFQWSSGAASGYSNWASGEPNNYSGSEDYTAWAGHRVELFGTTTEFQGDIVPCVRVRRSTSPAPTPPLPSADGGDDVVGF